MRRGLTEVVAFDEHACDSLVQRPSARYMKTAIDRLLDERVANLVSEFGVVVLLDDQARLDQGIQPLIRVVHGLCPEPVQFRDVHGPSDDSEQFERFPALRVKALDAGGDPVRQSSRNLRQAGRRKVGTLVEQGLEEGNREQAGSPATR